MSRLEYKLQQSKSMALKGLSLCYNHICGMDQEVVAPHQVVSMSKGITQIFVRHTNVYSSICIMCT